MSGEIQWIEEELNKIARKIWQYVNKRVEEINKELKEKGINGETIVETTYFEWEIPCEIKIWDMKECADLTTMAEEVGVDTSINHEDFRKWLEKEGGKDGVYILREMGYR